MIPCKGLLLKSPKLPHCLEFLNPSSENGKLKEKSTLSKPQEECVSMTSKVLIHHPSPKKKIKRLIPSSSTPESLPANKRMISTGRKNSSKQVFLTNIPDIQFLKSQTLDQELISRDQDFYEFWDPSKKETYRQLSWLQETEWLGLASSSLNGSVKNPELKSWFLTTQTVPLKKNLEKTSCPLFKYTVVDGMEEEGTLPKTLRKTFKLRIKPTQEQKKILNQWSGCLRVTYNETINQLTKPNNCLKSKISLQNRLVVKKDRKTGSINPYLTKRAWLENCPSSMRKYAVREAKANLQACYSNLRNNNIDSFKKPLKTKRRELSEGWSWSLEKANISRKDDDKSTKGEMRSLYIFGKLLGEMKYCRYKQLKKLIEDKHPPSDCKIQKDKYGDYYLIVTKQVKCQERVKEVKKPVSGDPGVRKFLTTYSPEDGAKMYGVRWVETVMPLSLLFDNLQSKLEIQRGKEREHTKAKMVRLRKRIFNLKNEMHKKIANDITKSYDMVLLPKLDSKKLTIKKTRKLRTKVARSLLMAGHCKFFENLKEKCLERGKIFMEVKEHYTSKTCPCCGKLTKCDETFRCGECGFSHDRDLVGGLNILLRSVREKHPKGAGELAPMNV